MCIPKNAEFYADFKSENGEERFLIITLSWCILLDFLRIWNHPRKIMRYLVPILSHFLRCPFWRMSRKSITFLKTCAFLRIKNVYHIFLLLYIVGVWLAKYKWILYLLLKDKNLYFCTHICSSTLCVSILLYCITV